MWKATFKSLFARKFRLVLSALSIVLGIAFVAGSLMFTNMLSRGFDEIVQSAVADVNVSDDTTGVDSSSADAAQPNRFLSPSDIEKIRSVEGVNKAVGEVAHPQVFVLDSQDRVVGIPGAPGIASNWHETPAADGMQGARIVDGRPPERSDEIVIDPGTAERAGRSVGDTVRVATPFDGIQEFTLVGTGTYGSGSTAGAAYLFFTLDEAQKLFVDGKDVYQAVWISIDDTANADDVANAVSQVLPDGWKAETGAKLAGQIRDTLGAGMGFVNTVLLIFAAIALLVATLLIINTFSILVAQRSRELAVLRAIGATRAQVRASVLVEAVMLGVVCATLGIGVGYLLVWGLLALMGSIGVDLGSAAPELTWQSVVASYVVGIVITAVAALMPAIRASQTRPVEALSQTNQPSRRADGGSLTLVGVVMLEFAIALVVCGLWIDVPGPMWWIGIGCAMMLVGVVLATPWLGAPIIGLAGWIFRRGFGHVGMLAERNSKRHPRRTAATAATLTIGLALVTTVAVLGSSISTSLRTELSKDQRGDFVVAPLTMIPFDGKAVERVKSVDGVEWTASMWPAQARMQGEKQPVRMVGTTPRGLLEGSATHLVAGTMTDEADSAVLSTEFANSHGLSLGMTFEVTGNVGAQRLLVTGLADEGAPAPIVLNEGTLRKVAESRVVSKIVVFKADGADTQQVRTGLLEATSEVKTVVVSDVHEYVQDRVDQFQQVIGLLYGLLALALVISVLGIVNTLSLSVIERTREIGLLRAVGTTRAQIRRMMMLESLLVTVMGSLLGVLLGLVFGVVLQRAAVNDGITTLDVPWIQLLLFVVVAAVFGLLAAIVPARRAAKLPVLDSIATV
ncbi:MAG: FtsX-like permease family protein [Propionibacteriaceae bacterium]|nr:FtsX-like permease family protein [Propionibacteriaceae bacterium]